MVDWGGGIPQNATYTGADGALFSRTQTKFDLFFSIYRNTMIKIIKTFCALFNRNYFFYFIISKKIQAFNIKNKKNFGIYIYYNKIKRKIVVDYEEKLEYND